MPKFQFRLATVLRLREGVRNQRRSELAEALHALELLGERLAGVRRELAELKQMQAPGVGPVQVDRLIDAQRFEMLLRFDEQQFVQQQITIAAETQRRREALVAADRDVRVLEKLRDVQSQRHRKMEEGRESAVLDEIAGVRHGRQEEP